MEAFEDVLGGVGMVDPVVDDGDDRIIVRPVSTKGEAKKARRLLIQEIADMGRATFPKDWINADDRFGPTLVGAFLDDRLVSAALVGPAQEYAAALSATCRGVWPSRLLDDALQLVGTEIAETPGVAVVPDHRGEGIGLRLKRYCDLWAAQHDACLVLSIPTNDAARHMNEKVGYDVLPPQVALCIEVTDDDNAITCCFPIDGVVPDACWAFHIVAQPKWMPLAVGQGTVKGTGAHDDGGGIIPEWMYRAVVS